MSYDLSIFKPALDASGQNHVYKYWNELSDDEKGKFFNELDCLPIDRLNDAYKDALKVR